MEDLLNCRFLNNNKIINFLNKNNIELGENIKENKEIFINHVLQKYKKTIKRRARIRKKFQM
jgi:hypothetical protein